MAFWSGSSTQTFIYAAFTLLLSFLSSCSAEQAPMKYSFMKQATDSPAVSYYDYIIVGGGTAGCPLAATLSQNSSVLLLERGGSPYGNRNISNLATFAQTLADTSPSSPSQRFVSTDGVINAHARVLGGGTCLNAGFYTRASPRYVRDSGWDPHLANLSYAWAERTLAFRPPMLQWQSAVKDALLEAGVTPYNGFTYDHLYGTKFGGTIFDNHGHRHTAADLLQHARPHSLTVLLHATVTNILLTPRRKAARGVIYRDADGTKHTAYLTKSSSPNEIIVSAGALGSPQLLMLSGIGPRDHLSSLGIPVLVNNPAVGRGMADNPMNAVYVPSPLPVETSLIQVVGITRNGTYIEAASGSLFTAAASAAPSRGGFILEKIAGPLSKGHMELVSTDPDDNLAVTFNYFQHPEDLRRCVAGMETIERVIESRAFARFRYPFLSVRSLLNMTASVPVNMRPRHGGNGFVSMEQFCRDTVMTIWHYHGGCQVGRVVDGDYRVIGVDRLRVVDGSTFNASPGTNPQATVMMLGRYMGVKILNERLKYHHKTEQEGSN